MPIQTIKIASKVCSQCCQNPCLAYIERRMRNQQTDSPKTSHKLRHDFAKSVKQNSIFTNHESLPSFTEFISYLNKTYPPQVITSLADQIREDEYFHLSVSNRVYLDYTSHGLFSYSQLQQQQGYCHPNNPAIASTSSSPPPPQQLVQTSTIPFFEITLNSTNLVYHLKHQGKESEFESAMRKRIMKYMNMSEEDYSVVFTANQVSAFKILADAYSFDSNKRLLTIYDYKNEAIEEMIESSKKKGAHVIAADFLWPSLKINSRKLKKMISQKGKRKRMGLFVFPLQSRLTGARYSYYWMNIARENGCHILLDADGIGAKAMDTMGLSIFQPDFLTCSFYKIFGDNPSGFSCLFVKKSCISVLDTSSTSIGIISLMPSKESTFFYQEMPFNLANSSSQSQSQSHQDTCLDLAVKSEEIIPSLIELLNSERTSKTKNNKTRIIECRGLDHADTIGLVQISTRAKYQVNWLVNALLSLQYPNSDNNVSAAPLVKIYGPKLRLDRGTAIAFNIFDWKGEKIEPALVQKLADRYSISVTCGILQNICFPDNYNDDQILLEMEEKWKDQQEFKKKGKCLGGGLSVVSVSIGFLNNFQDLYRLWAFVARFLDADFVEKEKWKFKAINQTTVEI